MSADCSSPSLPPSSSSPTSSPKDVQTLKRGLAQMLKGGVIMDVMNVEQARIAEQAGAVAVMALERIPADIRVSGGVARMSDPKLVEDIMEAVSIPVMAKCRIGHFVESQILQQIGVDYIDESEVLTIADYDHHIDKDKFKTPFVCGARNLGEALRRIQEGASMIRTKGEAGTGNIVEAVRHIRDVQEQAHKVMYMSEEELDIFAVESRVDVDLVRQVKNNNGKLPVVNFAAGGVATPADAALCMQLGVDGVFVGSGIFKSSHPSRRAKAIVQAVSHFNNPSELVRVSRDIGEPMTGIGMLKTLTDKWSVKESTVKASVVGERGASSSSSQFCNKREEIGECEQNVIDANGTAVGVNNKGGELCSL
eukprot:GHVS01019153.1.p1 GENE.GHVS01019153.1~~GHVS01019153.1.p1  ORF type:complete len:383 (+),score=83.66 GHVS01019153.1:53-1150(+)